MGKTIRGGGGIGGSRVGSNATGIDDEAPGDAGADFQTNFLPEAHVPGDTDDAVFADEADESEIAPEVSSGALRDSVFTVGRFLGLDDVVRLAERVRAIRKLSILCTSMSGLGPTDCLSAVEATSSVLLPPPRNFMISFR